MINRKNRFLSGFLSFIMVLMVVLEILPPVSVYAASKPTIQTLSATDITSSSALLRGKVTTNGGVLIEEYGFGVKINSGSWKYPYREYEHIDSGKVVTYELEDLEPGDFVEYYFYAINSVGESSASGNYQEFEVPSELEISEDYLEFDAGGGTDTFKVTADSAYKVTVSSGSTWLSVSPTSASSSKTITVTCKSNTDTKSRSGLIKVTHTSTGDVYEVEVEQEGEEAPSVTSITASSTTPKTVTDVTFTIKTNKEAKYGVEIYADSTYLGKVTSKTSYTNYYQYKYTHQFMSKGSKKIYAYPIDEDGDIDKSEGDYCTITVKADSGQCGAPAITTTNGTKIGLDESIKITWTKPSSPSSGVKYNVYLDNEVLNDDPITNTYYTIPASAFDGEGTYAVSVYAFAAGYTQSSPSAINVIVQEVEEVPSVTSITASSTTPKTVTDVTFTIKTNKEAKYGVEIYADSTYLGKVTSKTTGSDYYQYKYIHQFMSKGSKKIYAYPIDEDGDIDKGEGAYCTITVKADSGQCGAPAITTTNGAKIGLNESIKITWTKPSSPSSGVKYNVYLDNEVLNDDPITNTYYTIPASAFDGEGTYAVSVYAFAAGYTQSSPSAINVVVQEVNDAVVNSITPSVTTVNTQVAVDFEVITNSGAKYGVDIYAGEYHLARVTSGTKTGNQIVYKYTGHKFTSAGVKTIYAYPLTSANGNPDKSVSASCKITVNAPYGRIGNPEFTTANNQTIAVDESFTVAWNKPTAPSSGITYNVYVMKAGTNENEVVKEGITSRSCSIPASFFEDEGRYVITVYALASGYAQNATGATLVVNVKSDDSVYVMSVTPSATDTKTLTDVDFTIKTSTSAKYGVAIYAGKYHLATVEKKTSYSGYIKYVYENHNFTSGGVKNIYVYPLDASGKIIQDEGTYATCSIQVTATSACGAPSITTATNQTINFNSDFKVAWTKPSVPSSGVKYNVYVRHSYSEDGEPLDNADRVVNSSMITSTSLTIDSSYFTEKGSYTITVYAMAPGYTQSSPAAITVYVTDGYRLQVNAKELTAYEGGGKGNNITVTANIGWSVSSDVNWISFNTSSGNGNGQFYPIIDANDSAEERSGNIIVSGGGITRKILVKQGGVLINTSAQEDSVYNQDVATVRVEVFAQEKAGIERYVLTEGVSVSYGRSTTKTDSNGIATIAYDADSGYDLIISKAGYSSQTIEAKRLSNNGGVINITLKLAEANVKPVINAVWVLDTNLLKDAYAIDLLSKYSTSFVADVDWGSDSYGSISLWQNGKQAKFTGNKLQTVLSEKFDVSQTIYIVAINASGKETREKLKFDVSGGYPEWLDKADLNFTDSFSFELPTNIPLLGGKKMEVDLDNVESLPINFCVDGNKVYASIGLNLLSYKNEDSYVTNAVTKDSAHRLKEDVKFIKELFVEAKDGMTTAINYDWGKFFKDLKSKYNQQLKYPKGKFLVEGDVKAIGFLEGYINSYGELVFLDSGLIINPEFAVKLSGTFTIPVAPMIPLVWEAALKGELNARLNLLANQAAKGFIPYGDFDGKVSLSGGLGVGIAKVASVTGGIKGTLEPTYEMYRDLSSHFKLDASFGVYAKIQVAIFEHTWDYELARSTWYEYPSARSYRMYSLSANEEATLLGDYSDTSDYELQNREYVNYYSGFTMNENVDVAPYALARTFSMRSDVSTDKTTVFYENIYPNAEPVIGTFDDGTMIAVYIGDDTTRTDINRTRLYYSFYNGIEWSQPIPVDANGKTADFAPALVIAQNKAFITWQDATKTFSNSDSLDSIAPYFDTSIAVFDPTNKNIVTHTIEYTGLDMNPIICANNNSVSVVWVNNALNDWYGCNNTNSILAYTYTDNGWGNVVNLKSSLTSVRSIDAQYIGNVLNTIYSIDTDNIVETVTDINTYLLRNSSNSIVKSNSGIVNSAIIRNGTIYWQENGNIMYCDVNNLSVVNSIFSSDVTYSINAYNVLDNGYEKYAIIVIGDGLYSKLGISVFDDSSMTWSDIVYITDGSNMISDYDAVITSDGFVRVIATQTAVLGDMSSSNPYGLSDIIICDVYINGDLTVADVTFDMSKTVGDTTAEVYAHVVNNGKETIDGSVISIYDRNWNLISTSIDATEIKPGAEATLIAYMDIDDAIIGSDVIVVVKPRGINDVNQTDNSVEVTVNYFDLAVEQIAYGMKSNGKVVIYANIVNRGYRTERNINVCLTKNTADASHSSNINWISGLYSFDAIPVKFEVPYEEGAVYYITIEESDGDMMTSNNQDFVVLSDTSDADEYLIGDVNLDGSVTIDDATLLLQHVAKITTITDDIALANAEVTGDGTVTIDDATKLLQYVAKIIGSLD